MFRRVPQPHLNAALRPSEQHSFWSALAVTLVGAVLVFYGAEHLTGVETVDGGTAWETQIVKACSSGGLKYPEVAPPPAPKGADPGADAEALERWARQASKPPPAWKVRIDTEAKTPCPT